MRMKRMINQLITFSLLLLLAAPGGLFADPPLPTPAGRVVWIKGELNAIMPNNERRTLQKESVIYVKDTLVTDATSQAQIVFTDNTLMTFREGTRFFVNQYAYNPQTSSGKSVGKYLMNLIEGGFRTITGLIAKNNPSDYQVNTPVATIGVRGTEYEVYVKGNEVYIGYFHGSPCIKSDKKTEELCLNEQRPYGYVQNANTAPVPVQQRPEVFKQTLNIVPAVITQFTGGGGAQGLPSTYSTSPITSFCITQ